MGQGFFQITGHFVFVPEYLRWLNTCRRMLTTRLIPRVFLYNEFKPLWFKDQAQLRIYGELVCKEFARSFYNLWRLHANRNCTTPSIEACVGHGDRDRSSALWLNIFTVSRSETLFKSPISFGERIISFE